MSDKGQASRRDDLTATTPDGKIELTEQELSRVSGGATVKFKFTSTTKDKVDTFLAF